MRSPARQLGQVVRRTLPPASRSVSASSVSTSTSSSSDVVVLDAWPASPRVVRSDDDEVVLLEHRVRGVRLDAVEDPAKSTVGLGKEAAKPTHPFFLGRAQIAAQTRHPPPNQSARTLVTSAVTSRTMVTAFLPVAVPLPHSSSSRKKLSTTTALGAPAKAPSSRRKATKLSAHLHTTSSVPTSAPDVPPPPLYSHAHFTPSPHRIFTSSMSEADDLVPLLTGPVGLDMEWRFGFRGRTSWQGRTAILQLADARMVCVMQVSKMRELPPAVLRLLEDPAREKMGVNILADIKKLVTDFPGAKVRNVVELSYLAKQVDSQLVQNRRLVALATLVEMYTGKVLDKGERASDWEGVLREEQIEYAANDVHASMHIGRLLLARAEEQGISLDPTLYSVDFPPDPDAVPIPKAASRVRRAKAASAPEPVPPVPKEAPVVAVPEEVPAVVGEEVVQEKVRDAVYAKYVEEHAARWSQ